MSGVHEQVEPQHDKQLIDVPNLPLHSLNIPIPKNNRVVSKRRATNEGSALGIDIQLLATTDKVVHSERDISKVELSIDQSVNSSFRQSQYGGRDEIPQITTELEIAGGDKRQNRKKQTAKNSQSSILTPMFKKHEDSKG